MHSCVIMYGKQPVQVNYKGHCKRVLASRGGGGEVNPLSPRESG